MSNYSIKPAYLVDVYEKASKEDVFWQKVDSIIFNTYQEVFSFLTHMFIYNQKNNLLNTTSCDWRKIEILTTEDGTRIMCSSVEEAHEYAIIAVDLHCAGICSLILFTAHRNNRFGKHKMVQLQRRHGYGKSCQKKGVFAFLCELVRVLRKNGQGNISGSLCGFVSERKLYRHSGEFRQRG